MLKMFSGAGKSKAIVLTCILFRLLTNEAVAGTAAGDAGHYLIGETRVCFNNPEGSAFTLTIHRFQWWIGEGWNVTKFKVMVTGPDGRTVFDDAVEVTDDGATIRVPADKPGVYTLEPKGVNTLNYWYVASSLDQSVVPTSPGTGDAVESHWFLCSPLVPRKWYFFVPKECRKFAVIAQNNRGRSQREDHGLTVFSPRGQRVAVLWGQANPDAPEKEFGPKTMRRFQRAEIMVEPGAGGRFWAIEVAHGDSHPFSDINIALEGVPPYLSRSPEEWFNAETGGKANVILYDETEFVQSDRTESRMAEFPLIQHWTPCPSLGDPDSNEIRSPARAALWNPDGRELRFVIGTYLPRNMFPSREDQKRYGGKDLPEAEHDQAAICITGADGRELMKTNAPLLHLHGGERWVRNIKTGRGIAYVDIAEGEHFWLYTYPATPMVWMGQKVRGGWRRFFFDAGHARNWYFFVPEGTERFSVRAGAADDKDVMKLEINTPDRTMAMIYDKNGEKTVTVPRGMDGKIWHVRIDWGSSSRPAGRLPNPRFSSMNMTLDIKGVPGILAPTWEQWFDPADPGTR